MFSDYNKEIADRIKDFMEKNKCRYQFDKKKGWVELSFNLPGDLKCINMQIKVLEDCYLVDARLGVSADSNNMQQMRDLAEFTSRINERLLDGCFTINFENGAISYRCFRDCIQEPPSFETISTAIFCPIQTYINYGQGILRVLSSQSSPAEAVTFCENIISEMQYNFAAEEELIEEGAEEMTPDLYEWLMSENAEEEAGENAEGEAGESKEGDSQSEEPDEEGDFSSDEEEENSLESVMNILKKLKES